MAGKDKKKDEEPKPCPKSVSPEIPDGPLPGKPDWNPAPHKPRNYWEIRANMSKKGKGGCCDDCCNSGGCTDSGSKGSGGGCSDSGEGGKQSDSSGSGGGSGSTGGCSDSASGTGGGCSDSGTSGSGSC